VAREHVQYASFEGHTVKHESLRCIYLSRLLNWVYDFAVRALRDANRLVTRGGATERSERKIFFDPPPPLAYLGGHETGYCSFLYCNYDVWFRL